MINAPYKLLMMLEFARILKDAQEWLKGWWPSVVTWGRAETIQAQETFLHLKYWSTERPRDVESLWLAEQSVDEEKPAFPKQQISQWACSHTRYTCRHTHNRESKLEVWQCGGYQVSWLKRTETVEVIWSGQQRSDADGCWLLTVREKLNNIWFFLFLFFPETKFLLRENEILFSSQSYILLARGIIFVCESPGRLCEKERIALK